ncbi:PAS domain S-box-containing protein [Desulfobaculum xiamenense]|uniref:PAS domain S-box-containing protein n=1 Tax=Desulfobaculum xiamenense TaxID=995050 RepID=A0A846QNF6_9BACT|nr:sigma 54-interacting transcriptional regulator [Desulfobaculum xiamenense]NJB67992.1 PAS domain S-box-containing protein [Desulfobaculum xiamenense]
MLCNSLNMGQFALDTEGRVRIWDATLETLTGLAASDVLGTSRHREAFGRDGGPSLADLFLAGDLDDACESFGAANVANLPLNSEWVAIGECQRAGEAPRLMMMHVSSDSAGTGVVQTSWCLERVRSLALAHGSVDTGMRTLAEHVPGGVALMQDDAILLANQTFCTMFGYSSPEEIVNMSPTGMLAEDERNQHIRIIRNLLREKREGARFQWTGIDKQGRKLWFEARPTPVEWNGRPAVISYVQDVTEYKQREEYIEHERRELRAENDRLRSSIDYRIRLGNIIGKSNKMQEVFEMIQRAGASDACTIIYGETGTGKELVAHAIHDMGPHAKGPFVPVNCGAIPDELFESEFFGHRKGAFTGAHADKQGLLDKARGGTLFLDELGEISLSAQAKLLRALGSGEYTAVGDTSATRAEFRVVAATNRNLRDMVYEGGFRQDLFYRINVIPITLPPLRERKEDIPFLVEHILAKLSHPQRLPSKDLARLLEHDWPGNVRELQNVLERYVAFGRLEVWSSRGVRSGMEHGEDDAMPAPEFATGEGLRETLERFEKQIIAQTLEKYRWNRSHTAAALGLPRKTLFRKMKKLGIS